MAVKILIKRKIKDDKINEASKLLIKARYNAMSQPGYISSETLSGCDDPNNVTVISTWQRIENWNQWKNNLGKLPGGLLQKDSKMNCQKCEILLVDNPTKFREIQD